MAHDPRLLVLDEPTNGLDPVQRDDLLALVARLGSELGMNVLLSSHLLAEVEQVCDAVVILSDGRATTSRLRGADERPAQRALVVDRRSAPAVLAGLRTAGVDAHEPAAVDPDAPVDPLARLQVVLTGPHAEQVLTRVLAETGADLHQLSEPHHGLVDTYLATTSGSLR